MGYSSVKRYNCMETLYMFPFRVAWHDFLKFSTFLVTVLCGISAYRKPIVKSTSASHTIVINNRLALASDHDISCHVHLTCV